MIIIHDPEQTAACHQTWVCDVEIHVPGSELVVISTLREEALEPPLSRDSYLRITANALTRAAKVVAYLRSQEEEKPR